MTSVERNTNSIDSIESIIYEIVFMSNKIFWRDEN